MFFQVLLRAVMAIVSATVTTPGIDAKMMYTFNRYLSLNRLKAKDIDDGSFD